MSTDDVQPNDSNRSADGARPAWFGRRKRIVSRELRAEPAHHEPSDAVKTEMHAAADGALAPADLIEPARPAEAIVVDPTAFSVRHRKRSENRIYRLAQVILTLAFVGAAAAIVTFLIGDHSAALGQAIGACAVALLGAILVRSSRLAYRLRGYAVATAAFAVVSLGLTFLPSPAATPDEGPPGKHAILRDPRRPATVPASDPTTARSLP